jgi:peptide-methionine (S)-S-oxide reductase
MLNQVYSRLMQAVGESAAGLLPEAACIAGRDTKVLSESVRHFVTRNPLLGPYPDGFETATFGMGCFWCSEGHFAELSKSPSSGIYATLVGYSQGFTKNPTYEEVCSGKTNHSEVVQVVFDPRIRSFASLLKDFWELHDPTTRNRQGNDVGSQYRSGIYFQTAAQLKLAEQSRDLYQSALKERGINSEIVTEIEPLRNFYPAEEYHQQYDLKPGSRQYCGMRPTGVSMPPF